MVIDCLFGLDAILQRSAEIPFQELPIYGADKVERFLKQQGEKDEKHVFLTADAAYFSGVVDVKMHQKMSDCEREI